MKPIGEIVSGAGESADPSMLKHPKSFFPT